MKHKSSLPICTWFIALWALVSCAHDPIHDTPHPDHGKITLTTDWSGRTNGIDIPAGYTVRVGDYSAAISGTRNTIDNLFEPGSYRLYVYNTAENITVSGTVATANYAAGTLGWLFTGKLEATIEKDKEYDFTVPMQQQVRELTFIIEPTGGTVSRIAGITATLSGVAETWNFDTNQPQGDAVSISPLFTKTTEGAHAGKYKATVRLLGVTGAKQKLSVTLAFAESSPPPLTVESDLTDVLSGFNADKKTPLALGATTVETPSETGFTAIITGWIEVSGSANAD